MKKIILISVILHMILIVLLGPIIKTRMEFDQAAETLRTEEVKQREAERKEQERLRREKIKLDDKTAKMLKREAEIRKKEEIKKQVRDLRKKRDEMMERRERELSKFREREKKDILAREKIALDRIVQKIKEHTHAANHAAMRMDTVLARYPNENKGGLRGFIDDLKVSKRIWSDGEIANEATTSVTADYVWDFEEGPREKHGGRAIDLSQGAKIVSRVDGAGSALDAREPNALAQLGPVDYGKAFTIAVSLLLDSSGDHEQVVLTNNHSGNYNRALRLLVTGNENEGKVILRTTGESESANQSATEPGAFPFGKWTRVVVTTDLTADQVRIFIDGVEMKLPQAELAEDIPTSVTDLREFNQVTQTTMDEILNKKLEPTMVPEMIEDLNKIRDLIAKEVEKEKENHRLRHELAEADQNIQKAKETLNSLDAKTKMEEMNNTASAVADQIQPPKPTDDNTAPVAEIYKEAAELEKQIAAAKADIDAASDAVSQNTSYAEARSKAMATTPLRPDLASALGNAAPGTVGELNEFRENLNRAENEMQDMNARADSALGRSAQQNISAVSFATGVAMSSAARQTDGFGKVVDMTAFGSGDALGDSTGMRKDESDEGAKMAFANMPKALQIDEGKIIRAAMPGRRFTQESMRKGWLYLDTWYVIGPWENKSIVDYTIKHPPEFGIDFDARYYDGKFADRPGHPYEVLKWEFYQSDQVRCQPPAVYAASTYYAYTDVWFEQARDMLIAVASDDASSVWLNGQIVWQDVGQSAWQLGEGYRKVHFKQGFNEVLVRIENGPTHCVWSIVLCPTEMLER